MKALTVIFGIALAGIAVSLAGSIYTAVQTHRAEVAATPAVVPTPAF